MTLRATGRNLHGLTAPLSLTTGQNPPVAVGQPIHTDHGPAFRSSFRMSSWPRDLVRCEPVHPPYLPVQDGDRDLERPLIRHPRRCNERLAARRSLLPTAGCPSYADAGPSTRRVLTAEVPRSAGTGSPGTSANPSPPATPARPHRSGGGRSGSGYQ